MKHRFWILFASAFSLFFLTGGHPALLAQSAKRQASPQQLTVLPVAPQGPPGRPIIPISPGSKPAKTTAIPLLELGSSSNAFSSLNPMRHSMFANDSLHLVGYIHRQDVTIWGGGGSASFTPRLDLSLNAGNTFSLDLGPLSLAVPSTYPQATSFLPSPGTVFDSKVMWTGSVVGGAPVQLGAGVAGIAPTGIGDTLASLSPISSSSCVTTSFCQGLPGEFWQVGQQASSPFVFLFKGVYNTTTGDVDWVAHDSIALPYDLSFDGTIHSTAARLAFSPDGTMGWIALLGDLVGGHDSVYSPILIKSTDGGATWGSAMEVDLRTFPWVADTLQYLWEDPFGMPAGSGRPTTTYDFGLTVDMFGNPHLFTVMGNATGYGSPVASYNIMSGLRMFGADVSSPDGGVTWTLRFLSPVETFRGSFGGISSGTPLAMDNHCQAARSEDGKFVFFLWTDSDTTIIGYGVSDNIHPDLYVSSIRVTDGNRTCNRCITCDDIVYEGQAIFPVMAPTVITKADTAGAPVWGVPSAFLTFEIPNDELQPCTMMYTGNHATFNSLSDYLPDAMLNLRENTCFSDPITSPDYVSGTVWYDLDGDGLMGPAEPPATGRMVMSTSGAGSMTDAAGNYELPLPGGSHILSQTSPGYSVTYPAAPGTHAITLPPPGLSLIGLDFGLQPDSAFYDMAVYAHCGIARPGFNVDASALVANFGSVPDSGTVTLVHSAMLPLLSTTPPYDSYDAVTHTITWLVGAMPPFLYPSGGVFTAHLDVPIGTPLGTILDFEAGVSSSGADIDTASNSMSISAVVVNSFDPNDKQTSVDSVFSDPEQPFVYTIRFQNTGTSPAYTVTLRDELDADLDPATFRLLGSSHPCTVSMDEPGVLIFNHPGIVLPDSGADYLGSQGYVMYEIRPKAGLNPGDAIHNTAAIYFDFNPPVITNTTENHYLLVSVDPGDPDAMEVVAFPVPAQGEVNFLVQDWQGQPWTLQVMDARGAVVQEIKSSTQQILMDCSSLAGGTYFWRISDGNATATGKLVVTQ